MEHKYYTPEIEEFHVGFECEISNYLMRHTLAKRPEEEWWAKIIDWEALELTVGFYSGKGTLDMEECIRVKHLDREDIESLGFILNVVDCGEDTQYNELGIRRNEEGGYFGTFFLDDTHGECNIQIFESFYRIKNKSELKKLLKQLGIDA